MDKSKHPLQRMPRKGCKDVWNAFMLKGAAFSANDIPFCPTTSKTIPESLISFEEAKTIHRKALREGDINYRHKAFIHFWLDDHKFDGPLKGIWQSPKEALAIIRHFGGMITPDFSTNVDFPEPLKIYNTFRMRLFGYWTGTQGVSVINNVRWGTHETWRYCWDGIPKKSIVAIGTVASGLNLAESRTIFEIGLEKMVKVLSPHTILVYGSDNDDCFKNLMTHGIRIKPFPSKKAEFFRGRGCHEQKTQLSL